MKNKKGKAKPKTDEEFLEDEFPFSEAVKGPVVTGGGIKLPVSIRLDSEVIDHFKAIADKSGAKYQTLINLALKEYIASATIKETLLSDDFIGKLSLGLKKHG